MRGDGLLSHATAKNNLNATRTPGFLQRIERKSGWRNRKSPYPKPRSEYAIPPRFGVNAVFAVTFLTLLGPDRNLHGRIRGRGEIDQVYRMQ